MAAIELRYRFARLTSAEVGNETYLCVGNSGRHHTTRVEEGVVVTAFAGRTKCGACCEPVFEGSVLSYLH